MYIIMYVCEYIGCIYILCRDIEYIFLFIIVAVNVACTSLLHYGR